MSIQVVPLGAGQDVGRSCVLVTIGKRNIMFDCGMHMGYSDDQKFPDFSYISKNKDFTSKLDCVIISHFHLDHCGALPYFSEVCGYDGPIYMTHPTKAISPILLEDYRKISTEKKGELLFTVDDLKNCMKKCIGVSLNETVIIDEDFEFRAYYAGHVLGAAMFYVKVGDLSVVYTGDYNMTPDRHLGAAWIDELRPDLLITETTYATTVRESKRSRERDFLKKIHDCVLDGGKVIIPVFALGRAQELCILIETYWERVGLKVPVYFSAGLTQKANRFYQLFISWTNQKIKDTFATRNMFEFKHIQPWNMQYLDSPGPMVLFSTPGMLHIGTSLEVFKKWAPNPKNMVILPGYCVSGTVGAKVMAGESVVRVDKSTVINVNLQVRNLSFSAHADSKGIMQLIKMCKPKNVLLVHGEKGKMSILKSKIMEQFGIPCYDPANGSTVHIRSLTSINVNLSNSLIKTSFSNLKSFIDTQAELSPHGSSELLVSHSKIPINGVLIADENSETFNIVDKNELNKDVYLDLPEHKLTFNLTKSFNMNSFLKDKEELHQSIDDKKLFLYGYLFKYLKLNPDISNLVILENEAIIVNSILIKINQLSDSHTSFDHNLIITWSYKDENIACKILFIVNSILL